MQKLSFLKDFKKNISKLENVNLDAKPPTFWYSTGNLALNRIISGSYQRGIPQGRVTAFVGPSDCVTGDQTLEVYEFKTNPLPLNSLVVD
jgi:hypothetical protein